MQVGATPTKHKTFINATDQHMDAKLQTMLKSQYINQRVGASDGVGETDGLAERGVVGACVGFCV